MSLGSVPRLFVFFRLARSQPIAGAGGGARGRARQTLDGFPGNGGRVPRSAQCQRVPCGLGLGTLLRAFRDSSTAGVTTALSPTFPNLRSDYFPSL